MFAIFFPLYFCLSVCLSVCRGETRNREETFAAAALQYISFSVDCLGLQYCR